MNDRQCSDYANAGKSGGVNMQGGGGNKPPKPKAPKKSTKGDY
jgi:hypothetical protein